MTGFYDRYICPHCLNLVMQIKPFRKQREKVVPLAKGNVLEIGFGSGLNLPYYDKAKLKSLAVLDPDPVLGRYAQKRAKETAIKYQSFELSAEEIPCDNNSFDDVVCTYTLCTIPDALAAVKEVRRVLKPGGRLIFSEHGLAPDEGVRKWQNRLNRLQNAVAGGCNLNRDVPAIIEQGDMKLELLEQQYIPGPKLFSYNYWGYAVKSSD